MKTLVCAVLFALVISRAEFRSLDLPTAATSCSDQGSWCSNLVSKFPKYCYGTIGDDNICCASCLLHQNLSRPDCIYGDRVEWCGYIPLDVACSLHSSDCCSTCRYFSPATPTSTVEPTTVVSTTPTTASSRCPNGDADPARCAGLSSYSCYYESEQQLCCATCSNFSTGISGCEYGDKVNWCEQFVSQCQTDPNVLSNCCLTCATANISASTTHKPDQPTCSDSADWCPRYISENPWACYNSQGEGSTCCATCQQYKNNSNPECLFGNRVSWCKDSPLDSVCRQSPSDCCATCSSYSSSRTDGSPDQAASNTSRSDACPNGDVSVAYCSKIQPAFCYAGKDYCCSTCSKLSNGVSGCEYGDKASWCSDFVAFCDTDPNVLMNCCQTCSENAEVTTVPPQ